MRRKIRQIDDFSASRINSTTVLPEKLRMGNLDGVVQMIRAEVRSAFFGQPRQPRSPSRRVRWMLPTASLWISCSTKRIL